MRQETDFNGIRLKFMNEEAEKAKKQDGLARLIINVSVVVLSIVFVVAMLKILE